MGELARVIRRDVSRNRGDLRAITLLILFRCAQLAHRQSSRGRKYQYLCAPVIVLYKIFSEWLLGVDLPCSIAHAGAGLKLQHCQGTIVNRDARIADDVELSGGVIVGVRGSAHGNDGAPIICSGVRVYSRAQILGPVVVNAGAVVGAGAVVLMDVPEGATAVGNPARIVTRAGD